jgi:exonuclease III
MFCNIGTWNVGGLVNKKYELLSAMKEHGLDVLSVSETKRKGKDVVDMDGGYLALWSGVNLYVGEIAWGK